MLFFTLNIDEVISKSIIQYLIGYLGRVFGYLTKLIPHSVLFLNFVSSFMQILISWTSLEEGLHLHFMYGVTNILLIFIFFNAFKLSCEIHVVF